jgi:hypothetical protein
MNSATDTMYSNAEIAAALQAQLAALLLTVEDPENPGQLLAIGDPQNPGTALKAFDRIELFDVESLTDAFRLLIISEQRVCVIIMLDEQLTTQISEQKILTTRMVPIALLISDRNLGDRVKALWGDPLDPTVQGAFALEKLARAAVVGQLLDSDSARGKTKVISLAASVNSIFLKDEDKKELPGRAAVMLELNVSGGTLTARIGPGANL